jgi:hypothetical protein
MTEYETGPTHSARNHALDKETHQLEAQSPQSERLLVSNLARARPPLDSLFQKAERPSDSLAGELLLL